MIVDRNATHFKFANRSLRKVGHATIAVAITAASLVVSRALAHDAPSGWNYPVSCCSSYDCRPVSSKIVSERAEGYVITTTGEVVGYSDVRVKYSKDSEFHWCSAGGTDTGKTICLFVPYSLF